MVGDVKYANSTNFPRHEDNLPRVTPSADSKEKKRCEVYRAIPRSYGWTLMVLIKPPELLTARRIIHRTNDIPYDSSVRP